MANSSLDRRGKPARLLKKGTMTTKSHRFEPFSQRVVKLKIDPIHRSRRTPQDDDNADTTSYFRASLEHWIDMNLSKNFTQFAGAVSPLCESLPQILYYEERIMGLLVEYIEKRDELCMEPLLDLLAQLARDLGQRFEKHFAPAVTLLANVAATHPSIEVIEWSFTCLAWIFKFLSRLLVPDLRQLLGIMSPYLGKEKQKHFVTRFAAESISFLIRKAALVYYKNKAPLDRALTFLIKDLSSVQGTQQAVMYEDGLMSMLSESIKGVKFGLYSNGADIMRALISAVIAAKEACTGAPRRVLEGVLINIIHSTTSDTFSPILDIICETFEDDNCPRSLTAFEIQSRMLFIAVITRKGSRIKDWKRVHAASLVSLDRCLNSSDPFSALIPVILSTVVNAMQASPMDELLPYMRLLMAKVSDPSLSTFFLPFCSLFADLGLARFQSVVLPYFQKFLPLFWRTYEQDLCLTLPKLLDSSAISFEPNKKGFVSLPAAWVNHMGEKLADQNSSAADIPTLHAYTQLQYAKIVPEDSCAIVKSLHTLVKSSLESSGSLTKEHAEFGRGSGFMLYCEIAFRTKTIDSDLWSLIETHGASYTDRPAFLMAVLEYVRVCPPAVTSIEGNLDLIASNLLSNLSSPSHELRVLSLELIRTFSSWIGSHDGTCISVAIEIEDKELTLETERHLNMQLRKLAIGYKESSTKKWLDRLLPNFCFGLLTKKLGTLVDTACEAMKIICGTKVGEDLVSELAIRSLTLNGAPHPYDYGEEGGNEDAERRSYSEYECYNVATIERKAARIFTSASDSQVCLARNFASAHAIANLIPFSFRSKALKVLNAVPHVAEKRARQIVPHFLSWATNDVELMEPVVEENATVVEGGKATTDIWDECDRKAMLSVFGKFMNPRVLYKASEVHSALMALLTNGDSEMQKLALQALFTWKAPSIQPYEENLLNILDEKRLKDELTVFVHVDEESTTIQPEHRHELMPVLFRLLYGRIVSRSGSRTNRGTQEGRRKMILRTLSQLPDFEQFVDIAYGVLSDVHVIQNGIEASYIFGEELIDTRRQFGLLKMIETMLDTLGVKMLSLTEKTMNVVLYCLVRACRQIGADTAEHTESLLRSIRQTGIRCLDLLFYISPGNNWSPHVKVIYREVIKPRLQNFAIETAQGVSGLLQLFKTWSLYPSSALYFLEGDHSVIVELVNILAVESARDEVKSFVMERIISNLLDFASGKKPKHMKSDEVLDYVLVQRIRNEVLAPHVESLLIQLEYLLRSQLRRQMTLPAIDILSRLAPFVQSSGETTKLVRTATYLLQQPADRVPPKAKSGVLGVLQHFLPLYDSSDDDCLNNTIFETITSLFDYFKDEPNRKAVSLAFIAFAKHDRSLREVAHL
ncbi:U3 snoRNP protein, partial [Ascosphaera aggregata]